MREKSLIIALGVLASGPAILIYFGLSIYFEERPARVEPEIAKFESTVDKNNLGWKVKEIRDRLPQED